jgi:hypothetical protein
VEYATVARKGTQKKKKELMNRSRNEENLMKETIDVGKRN